MTAAETLMQEWLTRRHNVALVKLRRAGCGCAVGSVYRMPSGDLLIGRRRALVQRTLTHAEAQWQAVHLALDEVEEVVLVSELSCRHAGRLSLPVGLVREAVEDAAAGRRLAGASLTL